MTTDIAALRHEKTKSAEERLHGSGYRRGGEVSDLAQDRKMVKKAVHEHEEHDHPGEKETKLKIKRGGRVAGAAPKHRADRRARGGGMEHKGKKSGHTKINIVVGNPGGGSGDGAAREMLAQQQGRQEGMKIGAAMAQKGPMPGGPPPGATPPHPPMGPGGPMPPGAGAMPPGGGMPPRPMPGGAPGGPPPAAPPFARGGGVKDLYGEDRGHQAMKMGNRQGRRAKGQW